jgi:hypothetical protein
MKEDFLHYVWQYQLFNKQHLKTTLGERVVVYKPGYHNQNSGPDFTEAKLQIGEQLWVGNVEIHRKASDWYVHNHEADRAYDTVILHVVWEDDMPVFRNNNTPVSTLELEGLIPKYLYNNYLKLFQKEKRWIACEISLHSIDSFIQQHWMERLYIERLNNKSIHIAKLLKNTVNNWESVLFQLLMKGYGLKLNGVNFEEIASNIDFSIVRKESNEHIKLEALLFGQAGLLEGQKEDAYFIELQNIYQFQKNKYSLGNETKVQFFRLRPPNFPTIRLAQIADLLSGNQYLFQELMSETGIEKLHYLLEARAGSYWDTHYTFAKESKKRVKRTSKSFLDLLLINTIVPLKFSYQKAVGQLDAENILTLIQQIKPEQNTIVKNFEKRKIVAANAMETQALLTLKNEYCDKQSCLQCEIGMRILKRENQ